MLRRVAPDFSEGRMVFLRIVVRLLVTANIVPSSQILYLDVVN
jgi:hypothetical protein